MIAKLFSLYPAPGDQATLKMRMLAYHGELADIHVDLLGHALRRLVRSKGEFLPSVYQIRRSAACVFRAVRNGRDPSAPEDREPAREPNVERLLAQAPRPGQPCPFPQLAPGAPKQLSA